MKLPRRAISAFGGGRCRAARCLALRLGASLSVATGALVVGFAGWRHPGRLARLMGSWLSERLGQQFVIENRSGAASNIAAQAVSTRRQTAIRCSGRPIQRDQRVALRQAQFRLPARLRASRGHLQLPDVMDAHPSVPANSVPEFIAYAKANPGKINMASGGNGTSVARVRRTVQDHGRHQHGARALSRRRADADDLIAGQVQVMFD